jgi:hypothetical protein
MRCGISRRSLFLILLIKFCPASLPAADVNFADLATGRAAIVDDKDYFDHLQPMEMEAESGRPLLPAAPDRQRAEFRRRCQASVQLFAEDEQDTLRAAAEDVDRAVGKDYPRYAALPWNFLKIGGDLDGEFPHTRGKYIILPDHVCRGLVDRARVARKQPQSTIELLLHEQMHVLQRAEPELFDSLYTGQWGLIRAKSIKTCPWLIQHQLLNPDAVDCPWVFPLRRGGQTRYIWPLAVLSDGPGPKRLWSDFKMFAFNVVPDGDGYRVEQSPDGHPKYSDLLSVREYRQVFGPSTNIYHPHEAAADLFAKLVLFDTYRSKRLEASQRATQEKAFGPLREWFRKNLGKGR